jgi:hypothetical protein
VAVILASDFQEPVMKFFVALVLGVAVSSVVLAIVLFVPVAAPAPPLGFVVVCGAPAPPPGFVAVCYDKIAPGLEDVLRFAPILGVNVAAFIGFGRAIAGTVRKPTTAI